MFSGDRSAFKFVWSGGDRSRGRNKDPVVEAACVGVLYQATPSLVANLACAIVLAAAAYQVIPLLYLSAWLIAVVFIGIGRFPLKRAYQSRDVAPAEAARWGYYYSVGSFLSGLAWGAVVILVLQTDSVLLHAMAIVFVAGLVAGAATSAASFLPAYYAFMVPPLVCTIGFLLWMQQRDYFVLALMTLLFAAMVTSVARRMNGSLKSAYALRLKNDALVEDLQRALERVGVANRYYGQIRWEAGHVEFALRIRMAVVERVTYVDIRNVPGTLLRILGDGGVARPYPVVNVARHEISGARTVLVCNGAGERAVGRTYPCR